jgi:hypothetical protein
MDYEDDNDFAEIPAGFHIAGEDDDETDLDDDLLLKKKLDDDEEDPFDFAADPFEDVSEEELL